MHVLAADLLALLSSILLYEYLVLDGGLISKATVCAGEEYEIGCGGGDGVLEFEKIVFFMAPVEPAQACVQLSCVITLGQGKSIIQPGIKR